MSVDHLLERLVALPLREMSNTHANLEIAAVRLRDLAAALADVINQNRVRLFVSEQAARSCAALCDLLVPISRNTKLPKNLDKTATEVARLLDEIFAVKLTLIVEPGAYAVLEVFDRWWRPLPYPKSLTLALSPIVDKLVTGITLRARWGQRSETLATRLRQALGDRTTGDQRLQQIAEEEKGLAPEIDDWLKGRHRREHGSDAVLTRSLRAVENEDLTKSIALLLLDCDDLLKTEIGGGGDLFAPGRRLANAIRSLASQRGLEIEGQSGEVVEYLPMAHETLSGEPPRDLRVTIVRPMVVRRRRDGSKDVVLQAIVNEANGPLQNTTEEGME